MDCFQGDVCGSLQRPVGGAPSEGDPCAPRGRQLGDLCFLRSTNALGAKGGFCAHLPFQTFFFHYRFSLEISYHLDSGFMPLKVFVHLFVLAVLPAFFGYFHKKG